MALLERSYLAALGFRLAVDGPRDLPPLLAAVTHFALRCPPHLRGESPMARRFRPAAAATNTTTTSISTTAATATAIAVRDGKAVPAPSLFAALGERGEAVRVAS